RWALQSLFVTISGGAPRYHLAGGASAAMEANAAYDELCLTARDASSGRGDVRLSQGGTRVGGDNDITVKLANDLPASVTVNAGAGEFDLDLHDLKITDARLNIGASSTTVVLPHPSGSRAGYCRPRQPARRTLRAKILRCRFCSERATASRFCVMNASSRASLRYPA